MPRFTLVVIFLFTLTKALAQTNADWIQFHGGYTTDRGTAVAVDQHANVFSAGLFTDSLHLNNQTFIGHGFMDSYVAKMDSNGNFVWIQTIDGPKDDIAARLATLANGDVIAAGTFADSVQIGNMKTFAQANDDVWLARLNGNSGQAVWLISAGSYYAYERTGGLAVNGENIFWAINFGADLIVAGDTFHAEGFNDALVTTLDFNGNVVGNYHFTGSENDNITDIACNALGHVYAGGRFNGIFYGDTANGGFDLFYAKLVDNNLDWMHTFGGSASEAVTAVACNESNAYFAGIFVDTLQLADTLLLPDAVWSDQVFVMNVDESGSANWYFVGFPDSGADYITDITVACNGDLLFTGLTTYFANQAPEMPLHKPQSNVRCQFGDTYVARMSHQGELVWIRNTLGTNLNSGESIAVDSSGHIYVTGYFTDSLYLANVAIDGKGGSDNFLFRLHEPFIACADEDTTGTIGVNVVTALSPRLFPNPSNGQTFLFMNTSAQPVSVSLSDVTGKSIEHALVTASVAPVSLFELFGQRVPGIYFVTLESNAARQTLKWVVTR